MKEVRGLALNEGRTTIFMNTKGQAGDVSEDCKLFLKAVRSQFTADPFSAILKSEVERIKSSTEWRSEYMRLSEWLEDEKELAREEGMKEGRQKGLQEGRQEGRQKGLQEGRQEGREEGRQEGLQEFLVTLVCKKLIKGESCEQIAKQLEESVDSIANIRDIAENTEPKYDVEKIMQEISK